MSVETLFRIGGWRGRAAALKRFLELRQKGSPASGITLCANLEDAAALRSLAERFEVLAAIPVALTVEQPVRGSAKPLFESRALPSNGVLAEMTFEIRRAALDYARAAGKDGPAIEESRELGWLGDGTVLLGYELPLSYANSPFATDPRVRAIRERNTRDFIRKTLTAWAITADVDLEHRPVGHWPDALISAVRCEDSNISVEPIRSGTGVYVRWLNETIEDAAAKVAHLLSGRSFLANHVTTTLRGPALAALNRGDELGLSVDRVEFDKRPEIEDATAEKLASLTTVPGEIRLCCAISTNEEDGTDPITSEMQLVFDRDATTLQLWARWGWSSALQKRVESALGAKLTRVVDA